MTDQRIETPIETLEICTASSDWHCCLEAPQSSARQCREMEVAPKKTLMLDVPKYCQQLRRVEWIAGVAEAVAVVLRTRGVRVCGCAGKDALYYDLQCVGAL